MVDPVVIDLDFRQKTSNHIYTKEMIEEFCTIIIQYILEYTKPVNNELHCYVLEKIFPRKHPKQPGVYILKEIA
jgi:hypothetical protein